MSNLDEYVGLINGLPSPEKLFFAQLPPLSLLKLEQRLQQLSEPHRAILQSVEEMLDWRLQDSSLTEQQWLQLTKKRYASLPSMSLKSIVQSKLEMRTCIAALRLRGKGEGPPNNENWGFGRWVAHINRNWNESQFALETVFPWLSHVNNLMQQNKARELERFILEHSFKMLQRFATQHVFDFEAVVIYVLKWNIINRSTHYNIEGAKRRFTDLVGEGLGQFEGRDWRETA